MHILIVEDEQKIAAFIKRGLTENGFVVDVAHDGEQGLEYALARKMDLIILDVALPKRDGWSLISELRNANIQTPVLFLTARDTVPDRVKGFDLGADDYLIKPFHFSELLARVRSLLRRSPERREEIITVGDLEIDPRRHKVTRAGTVLSLTPKEFSNTTPLHVYLVQLRLATEASTTPSSTPGTPRTGKEFDAGPS